MNNSRNKKLNMIMRFLGNDLISNIEFFVNDVKNRNFIEFKNSSQINDFFKKYMDNFYNMHDSKDIDKFRYYTGIAFREVNSLLRNTWDYETNGLLTEENKIKNINLANDLSSMIINSDELLSNIKTYRGVSLLAFKDYGINSLEELLELKNEYYYESGFTSTSLIRENSFFDRNLEYHDKCNIEIEYLIPKECNDGIPLVTNDLSYSKVQTEYLINKGSLGKIVDVVLNDDKSKAYIKMVFIPQKIWDLSYYNQLNNETIKK